jgi:predicted GIY-YIG superfamily endonuclease
LLVPAARPEEPVGRLEGSPLGGGIGFVKSKRIQTVSSFFVYMLLCSDGSYYVGHTGSIEKRISEHEQGIYPCSYTKSRLPVRVVFVQKLATRDEAFRAERKIKKWSRTKKEALIRKMVFWAKNCRR